MNNNGLSYSLVCIGVSIVSICSVSIFVINNNAFASDNRNSLLIQSKDFHNHVVVLDHNGGGISDYHDKADTIAITLFHRTNFADDTLFPQTFDSSATSSNDITLSDGKTLPARPTTLTINKIQANNTLALTLHSLNDKYLLTGNLKGSAKPTANSDADNAQFPLTGNISINKNTSYSVVATLAEHKGKQITLTITDAKTPSNFKVTIEFSPPHGEQPLAGI
jgi:predicted metallo-beta-lactamase superfamily hydrolase